ncbi:hypothetical protein PFICI_08978 [Pestalotiopsis fici W106-1]|uniref:tRNA(Ile)-lysidine synthetase n=1 Tax=Pestalotiopsis fici (strain W106-1 / CGMCC3.15140) TaxID=1229662 RepID=W3WZ42_PESFW|nr:uncharacterized protein PFICI_08978 [Pestalotiopsis fici W106-1]ETS79125.1 hypothetical protein PFICI_08978 [Pestalotiopsis fici W106-1]
MINLPVYSATLAPQFNLDNDNAVSAINITIKVYTSAAKAGQPLVMLPLNVGTTPTLRYDGEALSASDAAGPLALTIRDTAEANSERYWCPARNPQGEIVLRCTAVPRETDAKTPSGPRIDLRMDQGGVIGLGSGFLPYPAGTDKWEFRIDWQVPVSAPAGTQVVCSLGDGLCSRDTGSPDNVLATAVFAVGPLQRYPAWETTQGNQASSQRFGMYWMGTLPYNVNRLGPLVDSIFRSIAGFFGDNSEPFRVFIRKVWTGHGGTGGYRSFLLEYYDGVTDEQTEDSLIDLLAHETVHEYPLMIPERNEDVWYNEGVANYYGVIAPYVGGAVDRKYLVKALNDQAQAYYTSTTVNLSYQYVLDHYWDDFSVTKTPYNRGFIFLAQQQGRINRATGGRKSIDDIVRVLYQYRFRGQEHSVDDFYQILTDFIGESIVQKDREAMENGHLIVPLEDCFAKYGLRLVRKDAEQFEPGFDLKSLRNLKITGRQSTWYGMRAVQQVLHRSAKAISPSEFYDAVREACKPRFSEARVVRNHRPVALGISGGVDSMALAFLCSQLRKKRTELMIADNRLQTFRGFVVDHMLREGSYEEAFNVSRAVRKLGVTCEVHQASWTRELGPDVDRNNLPNLESAARRVRYRRLGRLCAYRHISSLMLAHHEDDQYETVLMRLMAGHRNRALRGMRKAAAIPECEGLHGAFDSGWVDDQRRQRPNNQLTRIQRKYLMHDLQLSIGSLEDTEAFSSQQLDNLLLDDDLPGMDDWSFGSMPVEDGGVSVYRPLLEFSKDRLIATCLENDVPWFEDHTNKDPTLTTRNSIRHMYRSCELPRALQKPRIIALSKEWQRRAAAQDAEAKRLVQRMTLHNFEPHAGTLVVQFPKLSVSRPSRYSRTTERYQRRRSYMRLMAALAIQRVIALVSPELQAPPVANLQNVVSRLFPALSEANGKNDSAPKGFNIAGLHFMPIESTPQTVNRRGQSHQRTWYISRQPYPASMPLPQLRVSYWSAGRPGKRWARRDHWRWSTWLPWYFWDNRYWIRLTHRLPYRVVVMPFLIEHAKQFRESLSPQNRDRLASVLKEIAPGKVRYTLPAIYSEEYLDLDNIVPRKGYPVPEGQYTEGVRLPKRERSKPQPLAPVDPSKMRLLALPTLDVQIPGLEKWLLYETRHQRADRNTLRAMADYSKGSFSSSRTFQAGKMSSSKRRRRS